MLLLRMALLGAHSHDDRLPGGHTVTQVWGLQRSGTNLLEELFIRNWSGYHRWLDRLGGHIENVY